MACPFNNLNLLLNMYFDNSPVLIKQYHQNNFRMIAIIIILLHELDHFKAVRSFIIDQNFTTRLATTFTYTCTHMHALHLLMLTAIAFASTTGPSKAFFMLSQVTSEHNVSIHDCNMFDSFILLLIPLVCLRPRICLPSTFKPSPISAHKSS